jgi:hypothetical protein
LNSYLHEEFARPRIKSLLLFRPFLSDESFQNAEIIGHPVLPLVAAVNNEGMITEVIIPSFSVREVSRFVLQSTTTDNVTNYSASSVTHWGPENWVICDCVHDQIKETLSLLFFSKKEGGMIWATYVKDKVFKPEDYQLPSPSPSPCSSSSSSFSSSTLISTYLHQNFSHLKFDTWFNNDIKSAIVMDPKTKEPASIFVNPEDYGMTPRNIHQHSISGGQPTLTATPARSNFVRLTRVEIPEGKRLIDQYDLKFDQDLVPIIYWTPMTTENGNQEISTLGAGAVLSRGIWFGFTILYKDETILFSHNGKAHEAFLIDISPIVTKKQLEEESKPTEEAPLFNDEEPTEQMPSITLTPFIWNLEDEFENHMQSTAPEIQETIDILIELTEGGLLEKALSLTSADIFSRVPSCNKEHIVSFIEMMDLIRAKVFYDKWDDQWYQY